MAIDIGVKISDLVRISRVKESMASKGKSLA